MSYIGEIAAIGAAIVWAGATWIYSQFSHRFSAMQLNIVKGVCRFGDDDVCYPFDAYART